MFESFIKNPVKVSVGVLIVALFGSISLVTMPKQMIPAVQNPVLSVETRWPGASPLEIEREIIQEQEEQLAAVEGLIKMTSRCRDSSADITLEFAVGTDIEDAPIVKAKVTRKNQGEMPTHAKALNAIKGTASNVR